MNIISPLGARMAPNTVPLGNLVWVDAINGDDAIAARGRMMAPFKTLTAAKNAAVASSGSLPGDTIVVLPGKYNEKNLLKNNVHWHFLYGAVVEYSGASDGAIFDTSSDGTGSAVVSVITGFGSFSNVSTSGSARVINSNASDLLIVEAATMDSNDACVKVGSSTSRLQLDIRGNMHSANGELLWCTGSATDITLRCRLMEASNGTCIRIDAGAAKIDAHLIQSSVNEAVVIAGGSGKTFIRAYEIRSDGKPAIKYSASSSNTAKLAILGARIVTLASGADGNGIVLSGGTSAQRDDKISLSGCVIIASGTSSIDGGGGARVQMPGGAVGTKGLTNVTAVPTGSFAAADTAYF